MKTDRAKKIHALICEKHGQCPPEALKEIELLEEHDICGDLLSIYNKVKSPGSENKINSLVAYLLGITTQRPSAPFSLEKRRTYGRSGFPDIDMDFDHHRRHEVAEYLFEKYGRENVSNIGTVQKLTTKNCLHKTIMVLDPDHSTVFDENGKKIKEDRSANFSLRMRIVNTLPNFLKKQDGSPIKSIEEAYNEFPEFRQQMDAYPEVYETAKKLEGGISAFGIHAAGFVLSPVPLSHIAPLHVTTGLESGDDQTSVDNSDKAIATQFTASECESLGLIKFDVLGLLTKTVITLATKLIRDRHGVVIDPDALSLDDKTTLKLLNSSRTDGIFQLEEPGMQRTIREIGIDTFNDLIAVIAMYRPGPLQFIPEYARRKRNPKSIKYLHPIVKSYTESTFGIVAYQEQAMQIFVDLAGQTTSDGYLFIKGAAKKKPELFNSMKEKFVNGATKIASAEIANEVWDWLQPFSGYAFNKSLSFNEKIITSEKKYAIQDLYNIKKDGGPLPKVFSTVGEEIDIIDVYDHGILPVWEITLSDGSKHKSTLNHKFLSTKGVLPVSEIIKYNLPIIKNVSIKYAKEKRLDMQGVQQSNSRIRWGSAFSKFLGRELSGKKTKRRRAKFCYDFYGISRHSNLAPESRKVQVPTSSGLNDSCSILSREGCDQENWQEIRVKSIRFVGFEQCYDLEVDSLDHLYCLSSGVVTSNSHACSYAYESWKTAYLKAHYPLEFMTARLSIAALDRKFDSVEKLEHDCEYNLGIRILPPHLNESKLHYSIVDEKSIRRSLCVKGIGDKAAEEIVKHQPYRGNAINVVVDFANKVGSAINTAVIDAMCDAGLFGGLKKSQVQKCFETVKSDRKKTKGQQVGDLFS